MPQRKVLTTDYFTPEMTGRVAYFASYPLLGKTRILLLKTWPDVQQIYCNSEEEEEVDDKPESNFLKWS